MRKSKFIISLIAVLLITVLISGCGNEDPKTQIKSTLSEFEDELNSFSNYTEEDAGSTELNNAIARVENYVYRGEDEVGYWLWNDVNSYNFKNQSITVDDNTAYISLQYEQRLTYTTLDYSTEFSMKKFDDEWKINFKEFMENRD